MIQEIHWASSYTGRALIFHWCQRQNCRGLGQWSEGQDLLSSGQPLPMAVAACLCTFDCEDVISQDAESCFLSQFSVAFPLCLFSLAVAGRFAFHLSSTCSSWSEGWDCSRIPLSGKGRESPWLGLSFPKHGPSIVNTCCRVSPMSLSPLSPPRRK